MSHNLLNQRLTSLDNIIRLYIVTRTSTSLALINRRTIPLSFGGLNYQPIFLVFVDLNNTATCLLFLMHRLMKNAGHAYIKHRHDCYKIT